MSTPSWQQARALHASAAGALIGAAEALTPETWAAPLAPGRWTPSQVVEHLTLTYEVLLRELAGGRGMALRTKAWMRPLLRLLVARRLLRGGDFPQAPAPRELRPGDRLLPQTQAVSAFVERGRRLEQALEEARLERPDARLTHAYFGTASLTHSLVMCSRHIQHHTRQLTARASEHPAAPASRETSR